jgi:hypothetical protein
VTDLTVEGANHYISEHGLINKNTRVYFEELPQWPSPEPVDRLRATVRSAEGVRVGMRATGNPGGPGHGWVKARYIDPDPKGYKLIRDPKTGHFFTFIPAKLEDNQILMQSDPGYEHRIMGSGPPALMKAWRWGKWDIVAGGYFDRVWNHERQVLTPFAIPSGWRLRRGFDWGSSKPSSLGFWAITDGEPLPEDHPIYPGRLFPRGSIIRIGEWYTVAREMGVIKPNQGMQLSNEDLGAGIWERSIGRNWQGCVADPSIWTQAGGRSIYDQMRDGAQKVGGRLVFLKADTTRVAGWKVLAGMMEESSKPVPEGRGLWVFETCDQFIRTVPVLQMDDKHPDDIDTDAEDHCLAGDTRIWTSDGLRAIRDLVGTEGSVVTIGGRTEPFRSCRLTRAATPTVRVLLLDGSVIRCTPDHRILTVAGWREAGSLNSSDRVVTAWTPSCSATPSRNLPGSGTTSASSTSSETVKDCIDVSGKRRMGTFPLDITSITGMTIERTTPSRTWSCSQAPTISASTDRSVPIASSATRLARQRRSGTGARLDSSGTGSTTRGIAESDCNAGLSEPASIASSLSRYPTLSVPWCDSALAAARWQPQGLLASTPRRGNAVIAESRSPSSTDTASRNTVHRGAVGVALVVPAPACDVFCLTVPGAGCFAVEGGAIVANCADESRYVAMSALKGGGSIEPLVI